MKSGSRTNILLVELLIAILFFMLSATSLIEVYAKTHEKSAVGESCAVTLDEARELAEILYAADDPACVLAERGFTGNGTEYISERTLNTIRAVVSNDDTAAGELRSVMIAVILDDDVLFELNCTRYLEKEAVQ